MRTETNRQFQQDFSLLSDSLRGKSVLITGGSGFFGRNLLEILLYANSHLGWQTEIVTVSRGALPEDLKNGHRHIVHDLSVPLTSLFPQKINHIIHAASPLHLANHPAPEQTYYAILSSMENILNFASQAKAESVLFSSSGAVYGTQPETVSHLAEDYIGAPDPLDKRFVYGNGKRTAETLGVLKASEFGFRFVSARCFAFSGRHLPLDKHFAIGNFVSNLIHQIPIQIKGDARTLRSYMDAEDLCFWLLTLLAKGKNLNAYNVGSDKAISIGALAKLVSSLSEKEIPVEMPPESSMKGSVSAYIPSIEKAKKEFGLEMKTSLRDSIQKMVDFNHA